MEPCSLLLLSAVVLIYEVHTYGGQLGVPGIDVDDGSLCALLPETATRALKSGHSGMPRGCRTVHAANASARGGLLHRCELAVGYGQAHTCDALPCAGAARLPADCRLVTSPPLRVHVDEIAAPHVDDNATPHVDDAAATVPTVSLRTEPITPPQQQARATRPSYALGGPARRAPPPPLALAHS